MAEVSSRRHFTLMYGMVVTLVTEVITCIIRFSTGVSAAEFNQSEPPLLLQIHHMFWSVPLLLVVPIFWKRPHVSGALLGISAGFIVSDLAHHFIVLPITVGNTGWHWP